MRPPFIIIGMHRSGTTLLAKVLESAGIFMGVMKDPNFEAYHFLSLNQQMLAKAGGSWIDPVVPGKEQAAAESAEVLYREHFKLNGKLSLWRNRLQNPAWGWKDPRNTFTLGHWLELYPQARVIHLTRAAEAVVKSLQARNRVPGEVYEEALNDKQFCLALHQKYLDQARHWRGQLGARYFELDYADLVRPDSEAVKGLSGFCGRALQASIKEYLR